MSVIDNHLGKEDVRNLIGEYKNKDNVSYEHDPRQHSLLLSKGITKLYDNDMPVYLEIQKETGVGISTEALNDFFELLPTEAKVCDAGSGTGVHPHTYSVGDIEVIGIDGSEEMIKLARSTYPGNKFLHLYIEQMTERFGKNRFDGIYTLGVLSHFESLFRDVPLQEFYNTLKPNGLLLIETWVKTAEDQDDYFSIILPKSENERIHHLITVDEMERLLIKNNFSLENGYVKVLDTKIHGRNIIGALCRKGPKRNLDSEE